jgi:hypothetical protein
MDHAPTVKVVGVFVRFSLSRFPSLLIDECVLPTSDSVDVSVSENAGG